MKAIPLFLLSTLCVASRAIKVGDRVPSGLELDFGFPPVKVSMDDKLSGKKVLLVGLPGAFTPT